MLQFIEEPSRLLNAELIRQYDLCMVFAARAEELRREMTKRAFVAADAYRQTVHNNTTRE